MVFNTTRIKVPGPGGCQIATQVRGDSSRTPIVLVHGALQSSDCFRDQFDVLAQRHFVVALDLPWHGQSTVPKDFNPPDFLWAESLRAVVSYFDLFSRPLILVGWSYGGIAIRDYCLRYDLKGIVGIVLLAAIFGEMSSYMQYLDTEVIGKVSAMADTSMSVEARHEAFLAFFNLLTKAPLAVEETYLSRGYNEQAFWQFLPRMASMLQEPAGDVAHLYQSLQSVPTLMLYGKDDELVPLSYARHVAAQITADLKAIASCGHSPFLERPEETNGILLEFLARCAAGGAEKIDAPTGRRYGN